jgi:DNA mismatch repair protein MutS
MAPILARQAAVAALVRNDDLRTDVSTTLREVRDIERLASRLTLGRVNGRDLRALATSLRAVPVLKRYLANLEARRLCELNLDLDDESLEHLANRMADTIVDEPPLAITEGDLIRDGYDPTLDELRAISRDGVSWISSFQQQEQQRTGIPTLKVGYNRVFGYYIEVTHAQRGRVPAEYTRKQTLKNAERYITEELKQMEQKVLGSRERADALEEQIFKTLRDSLTDSILLLQGAATAIAEINVLASLAVVAFQEQWTAPDLVEQPILEVKGAIHR